MDSNPAVSIEGAVLVIENRNPMARNALTAEFMDGVTKAITAADADRVVRAVVLCGQGEHFCAGGDLRSLRERAKWSQAQREASLDRLNGMVMAIRNCGKPVIAAVEGYAVGAGMALALACDLLVASRSATFKASYVAVGLTPDGGTTASLANVVPRQLANELCMSASPIGSEQLHALGVVNALTEPGSARADALALAARLAGGPARALRRIKQLNLQASITPFEEQMRQEARFMAESIGDAEAAEGISAFLDKRTATFAAIA